MWEEAILLACHIQNKVPYKKTGKTPYELWEWRKPNLEYLKVWGCLAKVMLPEPKRRNLVLGHVIVCLLAMLVIVHAIDFLSSKVIY